jgi:twitching motility protein PilT
MDFTSILNQSLQQYVSDVFLTEGLPVSIRKHGSIVQLEPMITNLEPWLIKILPEKQWQQLDDEGDLDFGLQTDEHRFRLNIARSQGRWSVVARPLPSGRFSYEDLGLPNSIRSFVQHRSGIVLVTGATGSGKSTTLAAMIHQLNSEQAYHIVTIEDPIEYVHIPIQSKLTQREVGTDTHSFVEGLRRVVRQSPDVIMIGEMRDQESIQVALAAALTGHLVLATLHTIDATQTLQRLMSYFPEHARAQVAVDLSLSLKGIVSQRLLPKKDGSGRVVSVELLTNTPAVGQLLRERDYSGLEDMLRNSRTRELFSFNRSLFTLIQSESITNEMALAYSSNPDELQLMIQGMGNSTQSFKEMVQEQLPIPNVKELLYRAIRRGASDLHITAHRPPLIRVNGHLQELIPQHLTSTDMRMLLNSVMNTRQRTLYEIDKEVDFALGLDNGQRFRVNAYFQRGFMAAAMRAIPSSIPKPQDVNIPESLMHFSDKPHGLVLVTGPTGSGKSTTLACMIDRINQLRSCRIITVEDPIEFTHVGVKATIDQREVLSDTKSYASALKYILRQDPDVVLVGEMRDQETIAAALTAAETGHLVFATLHTNDAVQTIDRIIDVFPSGQQDQIRSQLAASLEAVISQRLLLSKDGESRVPAFEVMIGTVAIRNLIRDNRMHQALGVMQSSGKIGMVTMDASLQELVKTSQINLSEALRYAKNPKLFQH